ncbi:MAG: RagB/SusD family nutrient uptake outer membrane protein [Prevotella sp.]|nr:RagB/SusD family nutrient uptake outer membrane protein [Prevotella sp.]
MKKIYLLAIAALFAFASCEDALDSSNFTEANTGNYPASAGDLNKELAALYGVMNQMSTSPLQTTWFVNYIMSDDANGAGGTGDVESHAIGHLTSNKEDLFDDAWHNTYVGIARASAIIYAVDAFDWTGQETTRNQLLGEAYFMRGLFYLWGVQFWGDIPAYWDAAAPDPCPQQSAEEVIFPHILADFMSAYNLMTNGATTRGDGHATKGAAAGFLARAYMFYEGFYKKAGELAVASLADVELPEQEGVNGPLTKAQVVAALDDAIKNGGYELVDDFRLLWQYTNEITAPDYPYVADLAASGKFWAGNGNSEEIFQVQYMNAGSWNGNIAMGFTNQASLYCGLRCDDDGNGHVNGDADEMPFGQGWGQGTINANLWDDWSDADPRKKATILNAPEEIPSFVFTTSCSEDAGYYNKKWMPITCKTSSWDNFNTMYTWWGQLRMNIGGEVLDEDGNLVPKYPNNNGNSFQGEHYADMVLLRLADVMLMHAELTGDATYMNRVQRRAGVAETAYSWQNIQNERRWEFAGEGIRYNDLRRWSGKNGGENCLAARMLERQNGSRVNYTGRWSQIKHATSSWAKRYAETDGFIQIPPAQIRITADETILKQNAGWGAGVADANISGTPAY